MNANTAIVFHDCFKINFWT